MDKRASSVCPPSLTNMLWNGLAQSPLAARHSACPPRLWQKTGCPFLICLSSNRAVWFPVSQYSAVSVKCPQRAYVTMAHFTRTFSDTVKNFYMSDS